MHRSRRKPARRRGGHPRPHARWSLKRSRGTGPRATVSRTASLTVGRGPVPRHAALIGRSRGTGPRATVSGTAPFTVGRGPVPRHATIAGKPARRPRGPALWGLKRSRGTGPRATGPRTAPFTVGRGPVPRHALGHARDRGGQAPALRGLNSLFPLFQRTKRRQHPICRRDGTAQHTHR